MIKYFIVGLLFVGLVRIYVINFTNTHKDDYNMETFIRCLCVLISIPILTILGEFLVKMLGGS